MADWRFVAPPRGSFSFTGTNYSSAKRWISHTRTLMRKMGQLVEITLLEGHISLLIQRYYTGGWCENFKICGEKI